MKRVLLVDDDAVVLRIFQEGLSRRGLAVETAMDGLASRHALRISAPDLVVLDLLMPKFTGVDVVKFMRSQPGLATVPVVILSNSYMAELAAQAAALGAEKALLKAACTPAELHEIITELLTGKESHEDTSHLLAA